MCEYDPAAIFRCDTSIYEPPVVLTKPSLRTRTRRAVRQIGRALPAETWALLGVAAIVAGVIAVVAWL